MRNKKFFAVTGAALLLLAGFFIFAVVVGLPLVTIGWHLLAGLTVLVITFGMFTLGWMGGGDAKLAAADDEPDSSRSVGEVVDDTWITTKLKADLAVTDGVPSTAISVKTVDGVVTLSGVLPSELALKKAVAVARAIRGVRQVDATALVVED